MIRLYSFLTSWWNNAVIGSEEVGTIQYIYIPSPPAMFPVAAIVPVRVDPERCEDAEIMEGFWPGSSTA